MFNASGANANAACHTHSPAAGGQGQPCALDCSYLAPCHYRAHRRTLTDALSVAYTDTYCLANSSGLAHSHARSL